MFYVYLTIFVLFLIIICLNILFYNHERYGRLLERLLFIFTSILVIEAVVSSVVYTFFKN